MITAFTGTREGMQVRQFYAVKEYVDDCMHEDGKFVGHHGDCEGADEQFHKIVRRIRGGIVLHPPLKRNKRAFCDYDWAFPEKEYLERDRYMVDINSMLIATPKLMKEERRSGTWYTVRYALEHDRTVHVFWPDGTVSWEYDG